MKKALRFIWWLAVAIVCLDLTFFCMWVISGQKPADPYFAGALTVKTIQWLTYQKN